MCFYYLKTARCICHFGFLSCLSFLTETSNTIIITAFAQNYDGLDSHQSFWCHGLFKTMSQLG